MDAPYIHVESTPISLEGDLSVPFTPVPASQLCIVSRSEPTHTVSVAGHWDSVNTPVTGATPVRYEYPEGGAGHYYTDTLLSYDTWTWAPATLATGTPTTVYINRVTPSAMVSGDTLVACWGRYDIGRASTYAGFAAKQVQDLPALTGLEYGAEIGQVPHFLISNYPVRNDFADGATPLCPVAVEPKVEVIPAGSGSLYTSLRSSSVPVGADDSDQSSTVIQAVMQPSGGQYPIDGTTRKFNAATYTDPADASTATWDMPTTGSADPPATVGGAGINLTGNYRIRHNSNAGQAWYSKGAWDVMATRGRAVRTDINRVPVESSPYTTYNYERKFYDENGTLTLTGYPSTPAPPTWTNGTVTLDDAIDGGPDPGDNPAGTVYADGLWSVSIPVDTCPPEQRVRQAFAHDYPWSWHAAGDSFTLHVKVTTTGSLWQFIPVRTSDGGTTPGDLYRLYGLDSDRTIWGCIRQVQNNGFNTANLYLRTSNDLGATFTSSSLGCSGQSPSILCMPDYTILLAYSDGDNVVLKRLADTAAEISTMTSPGPGKTVDIYTSKSDYDAPLWAAMCSVSSGSGAITVRTSRDEGQTWGTPVTVVASAPAQRPCLSGDVNRLELWYHNGTDILVKASTDGGATWLPG
ncbi:MAG TPA: hypothetical protein VGM51_09545 [Armatimonadota bacterium]|jgi:hypothetical protein